MDFFTEASLRLKQQLNMGEDRDVAKTLAMSGGAWAMRKKRGSFPKKEVFALAAQRPDLGLDPEWIITGRSAPETTKTKAEAALIQAYRLLPASRRGEAIKTVQMLAALSKLSGEEITNRLAEYDAEITLKKVQAIKN